MLKSDTVIACLQVQQTRFSFHFFAVSFFGSVLEQKATGVGLCLV